MTNNKHQCKLDEYERDIEDNFVGTGVDAMTAIRKKQLEEAATKHVNSRKSVTIRIPERDLNRIKFKAQKQSLPYQTYINILIHKDAINV